MTDINHMHTNLTNDADTYAPTRTRREDVIRFWADSPVRTSRRGHFWVPSERVSLNGKTFQHGPMFVSWEAPEHVTQPYPIVLVHGGTLQGTQWLETPDGRPGWAQRLVEAGYAVLIVDRPVHGRSPYHPDIVGPMSVPFSYEEGREVYFPERFTFQPKQPMPRHNGPSTQTTSLLSRWDPVRLTPRLWDVAFDMFIAPFGPLLANLAVSQEMDANRLARLLDKIGPAIILTHSASGPDGWLVADRRPNLVAAIVAIEPMGPRSARRPALGH